MGKLIRNGIEYGGGNGTDIFEVTQAEYDALVQAGTLVHNALYVITDAPNLNPTASDMEYSSGVTVKQKIDTKQDALAKGAVTSLNANDLCGGSMTRTYRCTSSSISNCPASDGTLMVFSNGDGYSTVQMFISTGGGQMWIRTNWGAGSVSWNAWKTLTLS